MSNDIPRRYTWHHVDHVLDLDERVVEIAANRVDDGVVLVTVEGRGYAFDPHCRPPVCAGARAGRRARGRRGRRV